MYLTKGKGIKRKITIIYYGVNDGVTDTVVNKGRMTYLLKKKL
jgi:hypothetical protein